jgi:hypothetical protein
VVEAKPSGGAWRRAGEAKGRRTGVRGCTVEFMTSPEWHISPVALLHLKVIKPLNRAFLSEPRSYAAAHLSLMLRFLAPATVPTAEQFEAAVDELGEMLNEAHSVNTEQREQLAAAGRQLKIAVRAGQRWLRSDARGE